jgi:hypothetical protein
LRTAAQPFCAFVPTEIVMHRTTAILPATTP